MPELPEVETIVRDLAPRLTARRFYNPTIHRPDVLRGVSKQRLERTLSRALIRSVSRRAKHAVILLDSGYRLVIQPRMTGSLIVYQRRLRADERRYAVFSSGLGNGSKLVFRDVRRLGTISLLDEKQWTEYTSRIGPEPLEPEFTEEVFRQRMAASRQAIKKVLMDQRKLAGVGNIYANEALFQARIDPSRPANKLKRTELAALHAAVCDVLGKAVSHRGTTIRDYRTGTGEAGHFQARLHVYGRGGQPCRVCGSILVTTHAIDRRSTTFCWRCQGSGG